MRILSDISHVITRHWSQSRDWHLSESALAYYCSNLSDNDASNFRGDTSNSDESNEERLNKGFDEDEVSDIIESFNDDDLIAEQSEHSISKNKNKDIFQSHQNGALKAKLSKQLKATFKPVKKGRNQVLHQKYHLAKNQD